jgi:CubicO group peptidase (beta-lactamase class C family)
MQFAPGANWSYAHTNFMILGDILAKIGKKPLATLLQQKVLGPMGLKNTAETVTATITEPVLHAFSRERYPGAPYEEATYWNPQWGTPMGASETTNIDDMITTAQKVGTGALLSKASYKAMTAPDLLGFGEKQAACLPSCFTQIPAYNYGLGIVRSGNWILQDPQYSGQSATEAYLPSQKIAIAVAVTYKSAGFDSQGNYANSSDNIFQLIAAYMSPKNAVPPAP